MQAFQNTSKISIILPDSILDNEDTLLLKTRKIGQILRTITMFRISNLYFYLDSGSTKDKKILQDLLSFLLLPPYLRKYVPSHPNLRHTAILPPLHSPNHTGISHDTATYIAGKISKIYGKSVLVDIGKKKSIEVTRHLPVKQGDFVVVKTLNNIMSIELLPPSPIYWNTKFTLLDCTIDNFLHVNTDFYVIGATKSGQNIDYSLLQSIQNQNNTDFLIVFGPIKGSLKMYIKNHKLVNQWINFIPIQGTKTVKIEEALHSSLSILNLCSLDLK